MPRHTDFSGVPTPHSISGSCFRCLPAVFLTAIFVLSTNLPLPSSDRDCADGGVPPVLTPLRFFGGLVRRFRHDMSLSDWAFDLTLSTTALNLHFCILLGTALALCIRRTRFGLLYGAALTVMVETSQLTGLFGLHPCAWRQFDVDDLILNGSGVAIGFIVARAIGISPRSPPRN